MTIETAMTTSQNPPALRVNEVTKHFADVKAVNGVSFDVADSELLALVGPSGCGKSTLLRMIAGLIPTESGLIELGGLTADDGHRSLPPEQRRVGLVFQDHALFPHLSVAENIGFGVRTTKPERTARVDEMVALVGLAEYGDRYPHQLSGGERQRVALARALAPDPALMLLDEPFASLDPNLRSQIRHDIVSILRSTRTPAVFVTHDQGEALAIGDRVAVMNAGRVAQLDTPERVFHNPSDRFVAAFMGEADFMTVDEIRVAFGDPDPDQGSAVISTALADDDLAMLRPDDVTFVANPHGSASITAAEFRGSTWCYTIRLASNATVRSTGSHLGHIDIGTRVTPRLTEGHRLVHIPNPQMG